MPEDFHARLARLGLDEADFDESFARSGGPGGQHVNKVSTAVTLRHRPTGLAVTVQDSRSQSANRELARTRLLDTIERARKQERQARVNARKNSAAKTPPASRGQAAHSPVQTPSRRDQGWPSFPWRRMKSPAEALHIPSPDLPRAGAFFACQSTRTR